MRPVQAPGGVYLGPRRRVELQEKEPVHRFRIGLGAVCALACCGAGRAAFIPVTLLPEPDILAGFIDVTYDAGSLSFSAVAAPAVSPAR